MKVKFLKKHSGHNPGEWADIKDSVANYLLKLRVVTVEVPTDTELEKSLTKKLKSSNKKK